MIDCEQKYSLLDEAMFGVTGRDQEQTSLSLPGVLAALGRNEVACFSGLQAHQEHSWHAFTIQVAALALYQAGLDEPRQTQEQWRRMLLELVDGEEAPWCLVVADLSKPAFMQPPVPEGTLDGNAHAKGFNTVEWPDELDVLLTARNHDIKRSRLRHPHPEHWVYALVSLQTMQGYSGRDNHGIARMNGGFGSRPAVAVVPSLLMGDRFVHDVAGLLNRRESVRKDYDYPGTGGHGLLWLLPWDGNSTLRLSELDPFFVEVCRRVRLTESDGTLQARTHSTKAPRTEAKEAKGATGDYWTPLRISDGASLTVASKGFDYALTRDLLVGETFAPAPAQSLPPEGPATMICMALARGQGKTEGFHERFIPIPPRIVSLLHREDEHVRIARISKQRAELAGIVRNKVLGFAMRALRDDDSIYSFEAIKAFDAGVDAAFFPALWEDIEQDEEEAARAWEERLAKLARQQLEAAIGSTPLPQARRYKLIAEAERRLLFGLRKHLKASDFQSMHSRALHPVPAIERTKLSAAKGRRREAQILKVPRRIRGEERLP